MKPTQDESLVYLVRWPDGITKAGFTSRRRWRTFEIRGASVLGIWAFPDWNDALRCEVKMDTRMAEWPLAWSSKAEVDGRLGRSRGGYRECHRVPSEVPNSCLVAMLASIAQLHCGTPYSRAMHVRTDARIQDSAYSHLDRYRFLTADRREMTGNGGGSAR